VRIATLSNAAVLHTSRWVRHFRARGHEVRLWSLEPGPADLEAQRLPEAPLPGALRYPLALPALRRGLAEFAPDLVDAHYVPNYGLLGALAGRRPLSVCAWGSDLLLAGRRTPFHRLRTRFVLGRADLVLADAGNLGNAARALGAAPERVHVVPWGVPRGRFHPRERRVPGRLLSTRMHEAVYDVAAIVEGLAPAFARHPALTLHVAGDGSLRPELERLAAARLPAGRFRFLGRLEPDALAEELAAAEFYLSASHSDSTSLSLLEAMASGALPVISDLPGNREWVNEGEGARLFAPGDRGELGAALERALAAPDWCDLARARNQKVIAERGDWDVQMARIEALFEATVAAARGAGR